MVYIVILANRIEALKTTPSLGPGIIHHVSDVRWTQGWPRGGRTYVHVGAGPVVNDTSQTFRVFRRPSASVYYCQRKLKNRKNGVGLGTRLVCMYI